MSIIFNIQNFQLFNCSLPIEEILQVHGENRPMVNLPGVDFRSQSREMPLIQHCCFELYFSITNYVMFVRIQTPVMKEKGSVWMNWSKRMDIGYLLKLWMHTLRLTRLKSNLLPKDTGRPSLNYLFVAAKLVEYRTRVNPTT